MPTLRLLAIRPINMNALLAVFSDWPHLMLLGGATLGGVLVGVGILKESEKWNVAAILVLTGVIIEPIFTLWLFVYDEDISRSQKSEIAALEAETAETNKSAASANERAAEIMKATAWRQFTPEQIAKLTAVLSNHSGKYVAAWIANDPESLVLALQFINLLSSFDRKWDMVNSAKVYPANAVWDIHIPDVPSAMETVQVMRDAFTHAGIHFWTAPLPQEPMSYGPSDPKVLEGRAIVLFGSRLPTQTQAPN